MILRSLFSAFFLLFLTPLLCQAVTPPAWLKPLLAEELGPIATNQDSICLLDYHKVEYLQLGHTRHTLRGAIRVLTPMGTTTASFGTSYNSDVGKVTSTKAWFIAPDPKKSNTFSSEAFRDQADYIPGYTWDAQRRLSLHIPYFNTINVGCVLAWEVEIELRTEVFDSGHNFANAYNRFRAQPLLHGIFEAHPCKGGQLQSYVSSPQILGPTPIGEGGLRWEIHNRPGPITYELTDFHPEPMDVSVRCVSTTDPAPHTWPSLARLTSSIIEPKIQITPELKLKAEALTQGLTSRWARIRALTDFVQKDITYLSITQNTDSLAGYRPHAAAEVLRDRFGDCKDKATLLAALLRATGDQGHVVLIHSGNPRAIRPDWPAARFNHAISAIPADASTPTHWPIVEAGTLGQLVLFDPTDPTIPLGSLPIRDQGGHGLISHPDGTLVSLPAEPLDHSGTTRKIQGALAANGSLTLKINTEYLGTTAADNEALRAQMKKEAFGTSINTNLQKGLPLLRDLRWQASWTPENTRFILDLEATVDRHARPLNANRLLFTPELIPLQSLTTPWREELTGYLWLPTRFLREQTHIALPEGFSVSELPKNWQIDSHGTRAELTYRVADQEIIFERTLRRPANFVDRPTYETTRLLMEKVKTASRRPIILSKSPVAEP